MTDTIQRLDVSHDATFARPAFELMREFPPIIRVFYDELAPKFTVNPAHTTIASANNFGDLAIRIGLFNNVAAAELKAEKLSVNFPNLTTREAVQLARETISLSHIALHKALPNTVFTSCSYVLNIWIALEGGSSAAEEILRKSSAPAMPVDSASWGASTARNGLRLLSRNDAEGWSLVIFGDPSLVPGSHLFLSVELTFSGSGIKPIVDQIEIVERKLMSVIDALGIRIEFTVAPHDN